MSRTDPWTDLGSMLAMVGAEQRPMELWCGSNKRERRSSAARVSYGQKHPSW
jgi:hypothetical protein